MQKQLVTLDNLDDFICKSSKKMYVDGTRILTPGARDELAKRGIDIEYRESCAPQSASCSAGTAGNPSCDGAEHQVDEILIAVAATLQKEYGVNDPEKLKALSMEIVKTLNDNISIF